MNNSNKKRNLHLLPYLLIAPSIGFFLVFYIYPILYNMYLSFFEWNLISPTKDYVGFGNFKSLFSSQEFLEVISNSLIYMGVTVVLTVVIALLLAVWLNKNSMIHTMIQGLVFSPYIISFVSVSFVWMWLMDVDYGLLNYFLGLVGIDKCQWINHPDTALISIILVGVWKLVGYDTLVII
ncbi:MAG: sugar ABC transporter permease, partial [Angelakisella sp.]